MKYLTQYKLFESNETNYDGIKETIKEILLPISDMGYDVDVYIVDYSRFGVTDKVEDVLSLSRRLNKDYIGKENSITIRLSKYGNPLLGPWLDSDGVGLKMDDEVKEEFNRMKDYLEYEGFNSIMAYYVTKNGQYTAFSHATYKLDFNEFIMNDFELSQLIFIAKV
jgi:predicted DNA binding CopG/RHH family protein